MTDAEVQEFVTRFAAAWAARDGNAFLDFWHPEGLLHTPMVNRTINLIRSKLFKLSPIVRSSSS